MLLRYFGFGDEVDINNKD